MAAIVPDLSPEALLPALRSFYPLAKEALGVIAFEIEPELEPEVGPELDPEVGPEFGLEASK